MEVVPDSFPQRQNMHNNQEGQSTIEFLSCVSIAFSFIFLFIKMALNFTDSYMVQYATYMASRTYLVMDNTSPSTTNVYNFAETEAKKTFNSYFLDKFIDGFDGKIEFNAPSDNVIKSFVGAISEYTGILSYSKAIGGKEPLTYKAESFLGKEVTRGDCANRVCVGIKGSGVDSCSKYVTLFDNGC